MQESLEFAHNQTAGEQPVTLSDSAVRRIAHILSSESPDTRLRVSVEGGGCSGFQYKYELVENDQSDDDLVLDCDGAKVLIDSLSVEYMKGSQIDFVDNLLGQSFQINNPNAVAGCGCGVSFSL